MIKPKEVISDYLSSLDPKEVLDIGCGEKCVSLKFLEKGATVTGIDKKIVNIVHKNFNFIHKDVRDFKFEKKYDLIIASLVLNFLNKNEATKIIEDIKKNTKDNGYNLIVCLSNEDTFFSKERFFPTLSEMKSMYLDWKIIKSDQGFTEMEEHGNYGPHNHNVIFMLLQKV